MAECSRYFYHPDHLGSTSYVTDASGEVYQHLEYMAFGETFVEEHSNTDRTPYLFNGKELDEETGLYYYGARYYDARTSVFQSVDRFFEQYPGLSPFSYAANNPLRYTDPSGDTIKDNNGAVAKLIADVNGQMNALNGFINDKNTNYEALGITKAQMQEKIGLLQGVLSEISAMQNSEQVYSVNNTSDGNAGMSFNSATGEVNIAVDKSASVGLIGHELLHGYQFETGSVSLMADNSAYGSLYDIGDETAGYERERMLDGGIGSIRVAQRTDQWTRQFGSTMTPPAYQGLPNGPINLNSQQGLALRARVMGQGAFSRPVTEVFKGWKNYARPLKTR